MAEDKFMRRYSIDQISAPPENAFVVTPNDTADLSATSRALYVGTAGNLAVTTSGGQSVTFVGVAAGTLLPLRVDRVLASGTTASSIVALW